MAVVAYARVSSLDQCLDTQIDQLRAAGAEKVFAEKISGLSRTGRDQLALALDFVREGDVFLCTRVDRVARSMADLWSIIEALDAKKVGFRAIQQPGLETVSGEGKLLITLLGAFAEHESRVRKERQAEGIARARATQPHKYRGRPAEITPDAVNALLEEGLGASSIAKRLGIHRSSVYRLAGQCGVTR
ncbi:MAG: recombinase family protein [Caulobacter sp.]|nr:recombinase family protein [Caulobacter sp.]